jgi:hypothetical protein
MYFTPALPNEDSKGSNINSNGRTVSSSTLGTISYGVFEEHCILATDNASAVVMLINQSKMDSSVADIWLSA